MLPAFSDAFPFFKGRQRRNVDSKLDAKPFAILPSLKVTTDRTAYRPGDTIVATIEVCNDQRSSTGHAVGGPLLIQNLIVEVKGLEKLDPQWLITPMPLPGSKQRRGERKILDSSPTAIVSDILLKHGIKKTYVVQTVLPKILPPSYKGTVIRYLYYLVVSLHWAPYVTENGNLGSSSSKAFNPLEVRTSLTIWTAPNTSGLINEEFQSNDYWGIVPKSPIPVEILWKNDDDSDWTRATDVLYGDDDCASQGTESLMQSPMKGGLNMTFNHVLRLQSPSVTPRGRSKEDMLQKYDSIGLTDARSMSLPTTMLEAEMDGLQDGTLKPNHSRNYVSEAMPEKVNLKGKETSNSNRASIGSKPARENSTTCTNNEFDVSLSLPHSPPGGYARGKSYNIRFDDQILVRFSPKNPDSTYYFGDVVGGVLNFSHEKGSRRCLKFSAILETREELNTAFIHPSRKNSPVITKVQSDCHEVVVDMLQTHFVFSIPLAGPPSFTTPYVSIQWVLHLEFIATPRMVDWTMYDHPLLIEDKEKGEWSIPLIVHPPLPRTQMAVRRDRPMSPRRDLWSGSLAPSVRKILPLDLPLASQTMLIDKEDRASSSHD